ncbi:MAG: RNA polymerase sigma factor [Terracidiphilus sp.]|jgi:RNA polymerase sigma-70 factor (ECF subfamily)
MTHAPNDEAVALLVEAVARRSRAKLVAYLAGRFGDIEAAEDAVSDAFASALAAWPEKGCPSNPEAWLLTAARRKLIDQFRRSRETAGSDELEELAAGPAADDMALPDRRLALLFACTHPAIDPTVRAPLMLQVVLGLDAAQIAAAFLVSPAAMAQRLVRAKTKIRDAGIPFVIPDRSELPGRLEAVLDSIYACFSEGWTDPAGTEIMRRELAAEAIFLGRVLAELLPEEPEVQGLLALMLYSEARKPARRSQEGKYIPLSQQNCDLWDAGMIEAAESALRQASRASLIGRYQLEAAIQSAHVAGARAGSPQWREILTLYNALVELAGSPVASINRALVVAELDGPKAGLAVLDALSDDKRLDTYQPYWAARASLCARVARHEEARKAYDLAIGLENDPANREFLILRRKAVEG